MDVPASALQKLQLAIDPPEVQQNTAPGTTTTVHPISVTSTPSDPESKQASNTEYQPTGKANSAAESSCGAYQISALFIV